LLDRLCWSRRKPWTVTRSRHCSTSRVRGRSSSAHRSPGQLLSSQRRRQPVLTRRPKRGRQRQCRTSSPNLHRDRFGQPFSSRRGLAPSPLRCAWSQARS
jgi:hypothetical protein